MANTLQIFVSHSHEDDATCRALVTALRGAGADVWYDEHNLGSGQLGPIIERELRERPIFVVILSPAALTSRWVEDECRWAYNRLRRDPTRTILPVLAAALPDDDAIWLFLQDFKRVEAPGVRPFPLAEAIARTLHALALTPAGEAPAPVAPQPAESADDLITRGKALRQQGKHAEALPLFERATQLAPGSFAPGSTMATRSTMWDATTTRSSPAIARWHSTPKMLSPGTTRDSRSRAWGGTRRRWRRTSRRWPSIPSWRSPGAARATRSRPGAAPGGAGRLRAGAGPRPQVALAWHGKGNALIA